LFNFGAFEKKLKLFVSGKYVRVFGIFIGSKS